ALHPSPITPGSSHSLFGAASWCLAESAIRSLPKPLGQAAGAACKDLEARKTSMAGPGQLQPLVGDRRTMGVLIGHPAVRSPDPPTESISAVGHRRKPATDPPDAHPSQAEARHLPLPRA